MKVSVVMSVYNGEKYLKEAINSILNQTFSDFEFIIVNDGSTDDSEKIIKSYRDKRIKLYNITNSGIAYALNYGINKTDSPLIARMDSDDISLPTRLEKQITFLNNNDDYILVGTSSRVIDKDGKYIYDEKAYTEWMQIKSRLPISSFCHPSVMFRKNAFLKAGSYPTSMKRAQDVVLFYKMQEYGKMTNLPEILIEYRVTPFSLSVRSKKDSRFINQLIELAIQNKTPETSLLNQLENNINEKGSKNRFFNYYLFLSKKFLWNRPQKKQVFIYLFNAWRIKPFNPEVYLYFFMNILPNPFISNLYNKLKRK